VGENVGRQFCLNVDFYVTFRVLSHAANLRHGTDGFTSPQKEGVLPLDHRSRLHMYLLIYVPFSDSDL
jgi:hypothetical protein